MSDMMMPSYWVGGMGNAGAGLQNAYAQQAQNANYFANQAAVAQHAQAYNPFANSGGSFGAMPAAYAAAGAAYGRATGGFGGAPGRVGTIGNPGTSNPSYLAALTRAYTPPAPVARPNVLGNYNAFSFNPAAMRAPAQSFSPSWSSLPTRSFTMPQMPAPAPRVAPDLSAWYGGLPGGARAYNSWNMGTPAQGGFGLAGPSALQRVQIHTGTPTLPQTRSVAPNYNSAIQALMAQRNFTQPADFASRFNSTFARVNPVTSDYFNNLTQAARQQPFINAYQRGTIAPAGAGGGWDIGGRARTLPQVAPRVPLPTARPDTLSSIFANRFGAAYPATGQSAPVGAASFASRYAPFANTAGTSPMARGLTSPTADFASRYAALGMGVGQPAWSPAGIQLADRLRQQVPMQSANDFASRYGAFQAPNWGAATLSMRDLAVPHAYPPSIRR